LLHLSIQYSGHVLTRGVENIELENIYKNCP
jgi:hypothetical protein